jgi:RNA polymerase sigma-70 factor (ECF subfamily)
MARRALNDAARAEDAVQETLARALKALRENRLREPEKLGAFVAAIARHVIADFHRESARTVPLRSMPETASAPDRDPLESLISESERADVRRALAALGSGDRDILRLSYFQGLTPAQIAERLGEPAARIRKRKSRALARLRRAFLERRGERSQMEGEFDKVDETL